jgi:WD40 repeat protein
MITIGFISMLLFSQYFGQNKIQYEKYDFHVIDTEHFRIYFHEGGDDIAAFAEEVLEDGYLQLSEDLGIEVEFQIPVVLYNSPNDFSQTNITLDLIEEAVGGFTELLKNRMVIPFDGDYESFRHVLVHELTHVFQFVIFFPSRMEALFAGDIFYSIPLWVMEGHAEYSSLGWDLGADIFMRDLVINNNVVPLSVLGRYGGYLIYKEGQAFYHYVEEKYGREKVGEFLHQIKNKKSVDNTFIAVFGVTVDDFYNEWLRFYQIMYYPKIDLQENFDDFARIVFDHKKTKSIYNTSTAISSRGDKIAFISDQSGAAELFIISSIDGRVLKRLVKAQYSAGYENLHLYQGGLSWSSDDRYIAFAARSGGTDVLFIMDTEKEKIHKKFDLELDGIFSPRFSPDDAQIIFSGIQNGYADIYLLTLNSGNLEKVTDDIYSDRYPVMSPQGAIAFVSDRPDSTEEYAYGSYGIFLSEDGFFGRITPRASYMASPEFDPNGGLFFVASYDSAYNLYWFSRDSNSVIKKTDILTGIYYPSISRKGDKIAFSTLRDYGYDVCVVKNPLEKMEQGTMSEDYVSSTIYEETDLDPQRIRKYKPHFTIDYFTASAGYISALGLSGLAQIGISDILGNHHISIAANFYGSLVNSDLFLVYWNLTRRTDFGFALFQYLEYYREYNDLLEWRHDGGALLTQYPLHRFFRVELGAYAYKIYETRYLDYFPYYFYDYLTEQNYNVYYPSLALVYDNVRWGNIAPHSGRRFRIEGSATVMSDLKWQSVVFDYRRYFGLSSRAEFATRLVLASSWGEDANRWTIGGPYTLHGFDYYTFSGRQLGFLNCELRFPFIDRLSIAFPIPIEFSNIRGALFADFGCVYTDSFDVYNTDGGFHLDDLKMGVGGGIRFTFLYMIFKVDVSRATNLQNWIDENGGHSEWIWHLTLGPEW